MFDLFGKKKKEAYPTWSTIPMPDGSPNPLQSSMPESTLPTPKEIPAMPKVEDPKMNANANYTVGINEHGRVQLRLQLEYGSATLTMNDVGTLDLIEDLAHCIRKRYKIDVTYIGTESEE